MQEHSVDLKLFVRQVFLVKSLCMVESLKSNWSISFLKPQFSCCMPICFLHSGRFRKDFAKFAFCRNHEQTESVVSKFMLLRWAVERLPQRHFPQQVPFKSDNVSRVRQNPNDGTVLSCNPYESHPWAVGNCTIKEELGLDPHKPFDAV